MTVRAERQQRPRPRPRRADPAAQRRAAASTEIPLARIRPNPRQPRQRIDEDELEALAASIREHGVLQPILVTETLDGYQLVAGERRFRAAQLAGLERIPAVIRQLADRDQLELALVENLQREDLNPIEEARAYRQLIDEFGVHPGGARRARRPGAIDVANTLRLLDLDAARPGRRRRRARSREGHARALGGLPAEQQARVAEHRRSSATSRSARPRSSSAASASRERDGGRRRAAPRDPDLERVEEDLRRALGTKVTLARSRKGGRIIIEYYSDEELGQLYDRLIGGAA